MRRWRSGWPARMFGRSSCRRRMPPTPPSSRRQPDNAALLLEQGQVAAGLGKLERAQALLAAAERARPDDARIVREREGIDAALAARATPPKKEELPVPPSPVEPVKPVEDRGVYQQGERAEKELRLYEARDLFRQAIREQPDNAGRVEHAAWFAFLNGFHDVECRDLLRQAMPRAQEPAAMERAARHVERELGLRPPADDVEKQDKQAFDRAMVEKAERGTAAERGGALVDAGNFQEGIPLLEQALAADPTNGPLELRLARAYVWAQRQPQADAAFARLNKKYPRNAALLVEQAQVAAGREMLARARVLLIAAEQARPGDARILLERSRIEARLINRKAALAAVDRMAPVDQRRPLATLARARAEHYRGQFGPARDGYIRALSAAPHLEEAAHGLAECRLRRGEMPGGTAILDSWMPRERSLDWQCADGSLRGAHRSAARGTVRHLFQLARLLRIRLRARHEISSLARSGDSARTRQLAHHAERLLEHRPAGRVRRPVFPAGRPDRDERAAGRERLHEQLGDAHRRRVGGGVPDALARHRRRRGILQPARLPAAVRRGDLRHRDHDRRRGREDLEHAGHALRASPARGRVVGVRADAAGLVFRWQPVSRRFRGGGLRVSPRPRAHPRELELLLSRVSARMRRSISRPRAGRSRPRTIPRRPSTSAPGASRCRAARATVSNSAARGTCSTSSKTTAWASASFSTERSICRAAQFAAIRRPLFHPEPRPDPAEQRRRVVRRAELPAQLRPPLLVAAEKVSP